MSKLLTDTVGVKSESVSEVNGIATRIVAVESVSVALVNCWFRGCLLVWVVAFVLWAVL